MDNIKKPFWYLAKFITSPSFQEQQPWVQWIVKKAAYVHQDIWTKTRFFGWITLILDELSCWLGLLSIAGFAITDWLDGKVARFKGEHDGKHGALLDGWADKVFAVLILIFWGGPFAGYFRFFLLGMIEGGGNGLLWFFFKYGIIKKESEKLYEHLLVGKIKFTLEVLLILVLWYARHFTPGWELWPDIIGHSTNLIIVLAILSVSFKML